MQAGIQQTLQAIEQEKGFAYPDLYLRLAIDGMLDRGPPSPQWLTQTYPRLKDRPPLLLYGQDFEPIRPQDVGEAMNELSACDDWRNLNPDYLFVPFACSGAGDWYCFWYQLPPTLPVPAPLVAYLWHDDDRVDVLARNLDDFIFRGLCQAVCDVAPDSLAMHGDFADNMARMLQSHAPYLSAYRQQKLRDVYSRPWQTRRVTVGQDTQQAGGLIAPDALDALLKAEIGFEHLNQSLPCEVPGAAESQRLYNIQGQARLRIAPIPPVGAPVYCALRALNWRANKKANGCLEYGKHFNQYCPSPEPAAHYRSLLEPFRDRLLELQALTPCDLWFEHSETGQVVDLLPYL